MALSERTTNRKEFSLLNEYRQKELLQISVLSSDFSSVNIHCVEHGVRYQETGQWIQGFKVVKVLREMPKQ